jgi:membrane protein
MDDLDPAMASRAEPRGAGRGRAAERPEQIPAAGWRDILWRVKAEMATDNLSLVAAGVAFYVLLAIFPAIAAIVSIYGLVADPQTVEQQLTAISHLLPEEARGIVEEQLKRVTSTASPKLSLGAAFGLLLAIWSANKGTQALITALNIVYDEEEKRSFLKLNLISLALTVGLMLVLIVGLALIAVLPALLDNLGLPPEIRQWAAWLRWPILALAFMFALAALYRYAPSRDEPRWRWVGWGAVLATVLWLIGSALFSWYVANFGNYNETYGSIGAVVVLMLWLWLSVLIVLLGAEVNAEMERQTSRDTTRGPEQPIGRRGAYVADTVGERSWGLRPENQASGHCCNPQSRRAVGRLRWAGGASKPTSVEPHAWETSSVDVVICSGRTRRSRSWLRRQDPR